MNIGDKVVPLQFKTTNGLNRSFDNFRGKWVVLYFYPKDATPGCTTESCDFRDKDKDFSFLNAVIVGVSRDSITSHEKFKTAHQLPFELISDSDEALCQLFDVIKMKAMYGKEVRGIERSTFLIDPNGVVRHVWRKVKVSGHIDEVLSVLGSLHSTFV